MYLFWLFIWFIYFSTFSSEGWLRMMTLILPVLVLIVSVVTLIVAGLSFWVSRRFLYYQLLSRYSESEMGKALQIMWDLFDTRKADESAFFEILQQYRRCWEQKDIINTRLIVQRTISKDQSISRYVKYFGYGWQETNQARRQVSQFFITAFEMFSETKALDKACFEKICELNSFKLLYYVVEWFELAHATSWKFDPDGKFTKLLEQSGLPLKDIDELKLHRPPITWDNVIQLMEDKKTLLKQSQQSKP